MPIDSSSSDWKGNQNLRELSIKVSKSRYYACRQDFAFRDLASGNKAPSCESLESESQGKWSNHGKGRKLVIRTFPFVESVTSYLVTFIRIL